jgi:murein DD-endopeptidase MepM/ murein hydrolase activator NlpD
VAAGARLGLVGASGRATGPHLHFEVRVRDAATDPRFAL